MSYVEVEMDAVRLSMVNEWIKEEKFRFTEEENNDYGSQMIVIDDGSHSLVVRLSDVYMETLLEMLEDSKTFGRWGHWKIDHENFLFIGIVWYLKLWTQFFEGIKNRLQFRNHFASI